jgi:carboxyl-terminal processing protease
MKGALMKKIIRYIVVLIGSVFLFSCGGSSDESLGSQPIDQNGCEIPQQNRYVHEILKEYYLWYQQVEPVIDYTAFNSPSETLDFLRYEHPGPDRFSYITSESEYSSLFSDGQYFGYGVSFETDVDGRVWVRFTYDDAPAGKAGMQRGDEIVSINGQTLTDITSNPGWANDIFGPNQEGYPIDMVLRKANGSSSSIHMLKTTVNINTVLHSSVIDGGAIKTGYLVFKSFLETSPAELATVFAEFKAAGVNRVVLDLRYNTGGRVSVANTLASYLNKVDNNTSLFSRLTFNDKHQQENHDYLLEQLNNALTLDQLIVITTNSTCSASEMIINGLSPYISVKTVGSTTCGKPVGMNPFFFCGNAMSPITFEAQNKNAIGGYFDGIAADCPAQDNVKIGFGDTTDPMLSQALYLAESGNCMTTSARASGLASIPPIPRGAGSLKEIIGAY